MNRYLALNLCLAALVLPISAWITRGNNAAQDRWLAARVSFLLMCVVFPWDFFSIKLSLWTYANDVGPRIFGVVPLNDSLLTLLCSFFTASIFVVANRRMGDRRESGGDR